MEKKYNCIMIGYEPIELITKIQESIDPNDLLPEKGLETEPHVTLLYGLHDTVLWDDVKKYLSPLSDYRSYIYNINYFSNDGFDVLKMNINCDNMQKTNKLLRNNLPHDTFYPTYIPHMTIAYLKPNCGQKYKRDMLSKIIPIEPKEYIFSSVKDGSYNSQKYYTLD